MSRTEIESAIKKLPASEVQALMRWIETYRAELRDEPHAIDERQFDSLITEAYASGQPAPFSKKDIDSARRIVKDGIASQIAVK